LKKLKFFENLPGRIENFPKFAWKKSKFFETFAKLAEKMKFSRKFTWKNRNFFDPDPPPFQISNQIYKNIY